MSLGTPTAIATSVIYGYIYDDDGTTAIENAEVKFIASPFMLDDNLVSINEQVLTDATGLFQVTLPQTVLTGTIVEVRMTYTDSDNKRHRNIETIIVGTTSPSSVQESRAITQGAAVITGGAQGPAGADGAAGAAGAPGTIAKLSVISIGAPTELNAINESSGSPIIAIQTIGGSMADEETSYFFDADGPAVNAPFVMATSDGGTTRWIAGGGKYHNNPLLVASTVDGRDVATDGTKLDGVETAADVTDETNVVSSLDGATLTAVTLAATDKVIVQDVSDSDNIKTVTAQSIADLASGGSAELMFQGGVSSVAGNSIKPAAMGHNSANAGITMPWAGEIYAISISMNQARTAGVCTASALINGVVQNGAGEDTDIDGTDTLDNFQTIAAPITFSAGDVLELQTETVAFSPTGTDATMALFVRRT